MSCTGVQSIRRFAGLVCTSCLEKKSMACHIRPNLDIYPCVAMLNDSPAAAGGLRRSTTDAKATVPLPGAVRTWNGVAFSAPRPHPGKPTP